MSEVDKTAFKLREKSRTYLSGDRSYEAALAIHRVVRGVAKLRERVCSDDDLKLALETRNEDDLIEELVNAFVAVDS